MVHHGPPNQTWLAGKSPTIAGGLKPAMFDYQRLNHGKSMINSWLVVANMNFIFSIDWECHNPN
jgi:hypothetical protein